MGAQSLIPVFAGLAKIIRGGGITTGLQDLRPEPPTPPPVFDQILGCGKKRTNKVGVKLPDCCVITVPANTPPIQFKGM